jgi:hypothetical protein
MPMKHFVLHTIEHKVRMVLRHRVLRLFGLLGLLVFLSACYPVTEVSYSNPQDSTMNQWLMEFKTGENKVHLAMRYISQHDVASGFSSNGFQVSPEQLVGLTRDQAMSTGAHVQFQLKRDAGTFNFDGWFKEANGSGHFTFTASAPFAAELNKQGYATPTDEQLLSMAMNDVRFALISELKAQGYEQPSLKQLVDMGNHGVRLEYVQGLKSLGYNLKSIDFLIEMKDHGVNLNDTIVLRSIN